MSERRAFRAQTGSARISGDGKTFAGMAAPFMSKTYIGAAKRGFFEQIAPEAFDKVLNDRDKDVVALFNHNADMPLGRQSNGTLRLSKDSDGLHDEIDLPDTTAGRDVATSTRRGDLAGQSFSFEVRDNGGEEWGLVPGGHAQIRTLRDVDVFDVGPVTMPAYADSTAGMRSLSAAALTKLVGVSENSIEDDVAAGWASVNAAVDWCARGHVERAKRLLWAAATTFGSAAHSFDSFDEVQLRSVGRLTAAAAVRDAVTAIDAAIADPEGEAMAKVTAPVTAAALAFNVAPDRPREVDPERTRVIDIERRSAALAMELDDLEYRSPVTFSDQQSLVQSALTARQGMSDAYIQDMTDEWIVYQVNYDGPMEQCSYAIGDNGKVSFGTPTEVKRVTTYSPV